MKSSFCIDLQRFMLIPTKFPLSQNTAKSINQNPRINFYFVTHFYCLDNICIVNKKTCYKRTRSFSNDRFGLNSQSDFKKRQQ